MQAACGKGEVEGDGVCPVETALLPRARHCVLDGVYHSAAQGRPWFGDLECVRMWDVYLP